MCRSGLSPRIKPQRGDICIAEDFCDSSIQLCLNAYNLLGGNLGYNISICFRIRIDLYKELKCNHLVGLAPTAIELQQSLIQTSPSQNTLFLRAFQDDCFVLVTSVIICPNHECQEYTITAILQEGTKDPYNTGGRIFADWGKDPILSWKMKPQSQAKQLPDYIPEPIIADYEEACLIQNLSPKASATLARRCLQGMIRDFWGVKERTLFAEINGIQANVDPQTWQAIDAVRSVGNIGAHMEEDINLIIDVDPNEAAALIKLIEMLIKDWYIAKQERSNNLTSVIDMANQKANERNNNQ